MAAPAAPAASGAASGAPCVVWLSGNSGAGKTFTGDALAVTAGFAHLDGDELVWSKEPAEQALWADLLQAFSHWFEGRPAPPALWQPLYRLQCARVRAALAGGEKRIAMSLTVYHRETRDFIRAQLPEHVFILLRCDVEELVRRARVRFAAYAASRGETVAAAFEAAHKAPYSEEAWLAMTHSIMRGLMPLEPDERGAGGAGGGGCHELDVTDGRPWRALFALLGLGEPPEDMPTEAIAAINYERFKKHSPAPAPDGGSKGDGGGSNGGGGGDAHATDVA